MKKRRLRLSFCRLISTEIIDQYLKISLYSCRTGNSRQDDTNIFYNQSVISVDIKPKKTETETPFFHCEYCIV